MPVHPLLRVCVAGLLMAVGLPAFAAAAAGPIQLHPKNPHYFLFRGKATALITSAEHYGMVLNAELDYRRYLETLARDGMNYTRIFSGSYVEPVGAFGIVRNTLAPAPGKFLAPWARSGEPGYAGGGNKFDLNRWDAAYLARLKDFIREAGRRGIVVELTLFCSTYSDRQWALSPFNPTNNVNGLQLPHWKALNTLTNGNVFPHQEKLTRHLVGELNEFDNLFFEIQNEPWADQHAMGDFINPYLEKQHQFPNAVEVTAPVSIEWQSAIARIILSTESKLPNQHLIAQNVANFRLPVRLDDLAPGVSIIHFHYAYPEAATWNYGLGRLLGYDETGFAGRADATYRREAWNFILAGGGLFNSLDYSFTAGHEDGSDTAPNGQGGGSPALRRQLRVLSEFLHSFDLPALAPDHDAVQRAPGVFTRVLSAPGREYAIYARGRSPTTLEMELPRGRWRAEWINTLTGGTDKAEEFTHRGGLRSLPSPEFEDDIALRVRKR